MVGINNPIFSDKYANDLGRNQFSGSELWHWPYTDPITFDFTKPETNPTPPLLTTQQTLINQLFQSTQGLDIVRIWLFEGLEGIKFDINRKIIGIDTDLLTNLTAILNSADAVGLKVYLCLFDSWVVKHQPPPGLPQTRLGFYDIWNATVRNIMKDIVDTPSDFINNVLQPLINSIANHPAVYGIDLMNEPEGMITDTPVVTDASMRNYITQCSAVLRPRLKVSVGCMRSATAESYSNLPIDFCDYHIYNENASLDAYRAKHFNNKPCLIGECGYTLYNATIAAKSANEVEVAEDFVELSLNKGYSGSLVWTKDFTSDTNRTSIIEWLKEFAGSNDQVQQAPMSFWDWLLSLFGW